MDQNVSLCLGGRSPRTTDRSGGCRPRGCRVRGGRRGRCSVAWPPWWGSARWGSGGRSGGWSAGRGERGAVKVLRPAMASGRALLAAASRAWDAELGVARARALSVVGDSGRVGRGSGSGRGRRGGREEALERVRARYGREAVRWRVVQWGPGPGRRLPSAGSRSSPEARCAPRGCERHGKPVRVGVAAGGGGGGRGRIWSRGTPRIRQRQDCFTLTDSRPGIDTHRSSRERIVLGMRRSPDARIRGRCRSQDLRRPDSTEPGSPARTDCAA